MRQGFPIGKAFALNLLLLAATGAHPAAAADMTEAQIANYQGADRQALLEAGAAREGELLVYATGTQIQPLLDRFHEKYPKVKVDMPHGDAEDVARKVIEEYQANYFAVDVFELSSYGLVPLREVGLLQPFVSPEMKNFDANAIEAHHNWVSVRESYVGIGYNDKIISPADAPKTFDDLLDPRWKGRMAVSSSMSTTANWVGAVVVTKGEDFVRKLGEQNFRVYPMLGRALANLTISGEAPLVPTTFDSHVAASRAQGAPIAWNAPEAVPVTDTSVALPLHALHPYAALLFADFLMSEEGQRLYQKIGYEPSRRGMPDVKSMSTKKLYLANRPDFVREYESWSRLTREAIMKTGGNQ